MTQVTELDLPLLQIGEQDFANDPDPQVLAARTRHPWLATSDFGVIVTDYDACNDILMMDANLKTPAEHIVAIMGGEGTNWARFEVECLIARDGGDHARIRGAVNRAFLPRAVSSYGQRIRQVVEELLDEWAPKGEFEFQDFASRFPVAVMFGLVGVDRQRIAQVKDLLEIVGQSFSLDRTLFPAINTAFDELWTFVDAVIVERRERGTSETADLLDAIVAAEVEGKLTPTETRDMLLFLFVAGYDTSKNQLTHIVNLLLDRPDDWLRCAADRKFCDKVVDEALRHSGVATSYRNVAEPFTYRDVEFTPGTMLIFLMGIVGRYSGPFEDGRSFDPERANAVRHTAFSRGMHICLGQFLARFQIAEGLHLIARRLRNPRRAGPLEWRLFPGVWGPSKLPIAFDVGDERVTA